MKSLALLALIAGPVVAQPYQEVPLFANSVRLHEVNCEDYVCTRVVETMFEDQLHRYTDWENDGLVDECYMHIDNQHLSVAQASGIVYGWIEIDGETKFRDDSHAAMRGAFSACQLYYAQQVYPHRTPLLEEATLPAYFRSIIDELTEPVK